MCAPSFVSLAIRSRRRRTSGSLTAAMVCAAALACADSGSRTPAQRGSDSAAISPDSASLARDTTPATRTDLLAYHITLRDARFYDSPAMVTFRNTSADTAYFVNCNGATPTGLQRETSDGWVDAWTSVQNECLSAPIVVPPGDTLRRQVLLFDGFQPLPNDTTSPPPGGRAVYRLIWYGLFHHYKAGLPFGTEPSLALRTSNRFVLTGAPR